MMKTKIWISLMMATAWLLAACSSEEAPKQGGEEPAETSRPLQLSSITRTGGDADMTAVGDIRLFMTRDVSGAYYEGTIMNTETGWKPYASANAEAYHIYGYSPSGIATTSLSYLSGGNDYKGGAVLTLSGLPAATSADVCVVAGVDEDAANLKEGGYAFDNNGDKKLSLLLDHVYASATFNMTIGANYSKLRTIRLKSLGFEKEGVGEINVTLTMKAGENVKYDYQSASTTTKPFDMFTDEDGKELDTQKPLVITGYFAPILYDGLTLVCTYDVYDDTGKTLIRKNSTSRNKINIPKDKQGRGYRHTATLTVEPTYLYQLSDADLDNPTININ